jgi:hypothetical protein
MNWKLAFAVANNAAAVELAAVIVVAPLTATAFTTVPAVLLAHRVVKLISAFVPVATVAEIAVASPVRVEAKLALVATVPVVFDKPPTFVTQTQLDPL